MELPDWMYGYDRESVLSQLKEHETAMNKLYEEELRRTKEDIKTWESFGDTEFKREGLKALKQIRDQLLIKITKSIR